VKFSFNNNAAPAYSRMYEANAIGGVTAVSWTQISPTGGGNKFLDQPVTFENVDFTDVASGGSGDGLIDVVFQSDGTAVIPGGASSATFKVKTTDPIPVKSFNIAVSSTGKIAATN
jgi:hypothetical protein